MSFLKNDKLLEMSNKYNEELYPLIAYKGLTFWVPFWVIRKFNKRELEKVKRLFKNWCNRERK